VQLPRAGLSELCGPTNRQTHIAPPAPVRSLPIQQVWAARLGRAFGATRLGRASAQADDGNAGRRRIVLVSFAGVAHVEQAVDVVDG
jgi:hypothetical protein